MTISLLTHGWVCYRNMVIVKRYVLPMALDIKSTQYIDLEVKNNRLLTLDLDNIYNPLLNLRLTDKNINIKNSDSTDINIDK